MLRGMLPDRAVIRCEQLTRTFTVAPKAEGLWASVRAFFSPATTTVTAVAGLDMVIGEGELVGFLGPNGAGKTTTLKMLSGLIGPTAGSVRVLGVDPFRRDADYLRQISLVMGQKQNLWWDLPPAETLALHREIYDIPAAEFAARRDELVEMLDIADCLEVQTRQLSLGQRMRCELATALLHRPRILFLDEPTIGLDVLMQKRIREFLRAYHTRFGTTVLLTSHNMDDVEALTQRVVVINHGRKVFDGALHSLAAAARLDKILTVTFSAVPGNFKPEAWGTVLGVEGTRYRLKVAREQAPRVAAELYAGGGVHDLSLEEAPLEDALADLFARTAGAPA